MSEGRTRFVDLEEEESHLAFQENELERTMLEFLEEEKPEKPKKGFFNFATVAGTAFLTAGMFYVLQSIGIFPGDIESLIQALPIFGGLLITIIGFGFFTPERREIKRAKRRKKKLLETTQVSGGSAIAEHEKTPMDYARSGTQSKSSSISLEPYALRVKKRLYKSRKDKKIAGVCGGLAEYFGVDATLIRLIFLVTAIAGMGSSVAIYLVLAVLLPKAPANILHDD